MSILSADLQALKRWGYDGGCMYYHRISYQQMVVVEDLLDQRDEIIRVARIRRVKDSEAPLPPLPPLPIPDQTLTGAPEEPLLPPRHNFVTRIRNWFGTKNLRNVERVQSGRNSVNPSAFGPSKRWSSKDEIGEIPDSSYPLDIG